jgi:hypothetical protein
MPIEQHLSPARMAGFSLRVRVAKNKRFLTGVFA